MVKIYIALIALSFAFLFTSCSIIWLIIKLRSLEEDFKMLKVDQSWLANKILPSFSTEDVIDETYFTVTDLKWEKDFEADKTLPKNDDYYRLEM